MANSKVKSAPPYEGPDPDVIIVPEPSLEPEEAVGEEADELPVPSEEVIAAKKKPKRRKTDPAPVAYLEPLQEGKDATLEATGGRGERQQEGRRRHK